MSDRAELISRLNDAAGDVHRDLNLTIARHLLREAAKALAWDRREPVVSGPGWQPLIEHGSRSQGGSALLFRTKGSFPDLYEIASVSWNLNGLTAAEHLTITGHEIRVLADATGADA